MRVLGLSRFRACIGRPSEAGCFKGCVLGNTEFKKSLKEPAQIVSARCVVGSTLDAYLDWPQTSDTS